MYVIQVVGYKNSGKTTLVNKWIDYLTDKQYHVATIKHHGHGGEPSYDQQTDSYQHFKHGSDMTTVIGEETLSIIGKNKMLSFPAILTLYEQLGVDVVIVEGYKHLPIPKVVLINDAKGETLVESLETVKYIFTTRTMEQNVFSTPHFYRYHTLFEQVEQEWDVFSYENIKKHLSDDRKRKE